MPDNNNRKIAITVKTAKYIIETASKLWAAGTGTHMVPRDPLNQLPDDYFNSDPGFLDELPHHDPNLIEWANALLSLARFVSGILEHEIEELDEE